MLVEGLDEAGNTLWQHQKEMNGTRQGSVIHMEWDLTQWASWAIDSVKVTLSGEDSRHWREGYDPIMSDMNLYLSVPSPPEDPYANWLATAHEEGIVYTDRDYKCIVMGAVGSLSLVGAVVAFMMHSRKKVENGEEDFQSIV